jgi:7-cyano-7-deazaguanine reductase
MVSDELRLKIKNLQLVFKDKPQPELLLAIPNESSEFPHEVIHQTDEFTSLCPLNMAQPDFANITIKFFPGELLAELKSVKYYLTSYRMVPIFHEKVPNMILKDLVKLLNPVSMAVVGEFSTRGGLRTRVEAYYERKD